MLLSCSEHSAHADEGPVSWHTGKDFLKGWDATLSVSWNDNPLRSALDRLSRRERLAIMLDRRVDPDQPVAIRTGDVTFNEFSQRLARQLSLGVCRVGPVIYFGPTSTTDRLATVAALRRDEVSKLRSPLRERLTSPRMLQWSRLAEPRELVKELAAEAGCEVDKLTSQLPHDLWPAMQLPPLAWADRMSLVLAGFELTFVLHAEEKRIELVPFPNPVQYENRYVVKGSAARVADDLASQFPLSQLRAEGGKLFVAGPFEDHEIIERVVRGEKVSRTQVRPANQDKVYSLKVENQPLGAVLKTFAQSLDIDVATDELMPEDLTQRVTFLVEKVPRHELFSAALRDTNLRYIATERGIAIKRK